MQKWEYLFWGINYAGGGLFGPAGAWKVEFVNGEEVSNWKDGPNYHEYCNRMGDKGWEMIELSHAPVFNEFGNVQRENFRIVMKRPKQ